ncbi:MAG: hypothetical protein AAB358_00125 [Patescibacteria group bacterium]
MWPVVVFVIVALSILALTFFSVGSGRKAYLLIKHLPTDFALLIKNEMAETDSRLDSLWEKMRRTRFSRKTEEKKQDEFRLALAEWQGELVLFFERVAPKLLTGERRRLSDCLDSYWLEILGITGKLGIDNSGLPKICWKMPAV